MLATAAQVFLMLMFCSKVVGISVVPVLTNLVVESWQIQRFNICHMLRFDILLVQVKKIRKVHKRRIQTVNSAVIRLSLQIVSQKYTKEEKRFYRNDENGLRLLEVILVAIF